MSDAKEVKDVATTTAVATTAEVPLPPELSPEKSMQESLLMIVLLFMIFYFMLIRPQQKRLKQHQELMKSLERGQKVITSGGILGTISKLEGNDVVLLEVAENIKIRMARSAITEVVTDKSSKVANDN